MATVPMRVALRALLFVLSTVLLAACAGPQSGGTPTLAATTPAVTTPAAAQTATQQATVASTSGELDANVTDGCVTDYQTGTDYFPDKVDFSRADGVGVSYHRTYKVVEVRPSHLGGAEPIRYVLHQCGTPEPELDPELAGAQVIEVPVSEVASLTTTNLPHFEELGAVDRLVGVGTAGFITTQPVLDAIAAGDVAEFADANGQPDLERLITTDPDLVIMDAFGEEVLGQAQRMVDAGVPTVVNVDFNEPTLLGRAEWLKFTALFLNAEAAASEAYANIVAGYQDVAAAAAEAAEAQGKPSVFFNTPFEGTWFMPGGQSFQANAVRDAGGTYVFGDDDSTFVLQLDIETVLARAEDAGVWLQAGSVNGSLADLLAADERFDAFKAFRSGDVWAYDKLTTPAGGNAVFELAYTRADLYLADLVEILHPDALDDHELVFFGRVPASDQAP